MGIFKSTPSNIVNSTSSVEVAVFTKMLSGLSSTVLFAEHNISNVMYVDVINESNNKSVSVVTNVIDTTVSLDSNVDLDNHTLGIKGF